MNKILSRFAVLLTCMSFSGIIFTSTANSLSRTTPGQAALELSRIHPVTAAALISQMNAGVAARIVSPTVMTSEIAAGILKNGSFGSVARILAPTVTASANAQAIWDDMAKQTPTKLVQGGEMHGMDAGTAAAYLAKNRSKAAQLLYSINAGTAVHILAPTVMMSSDAKKILSEVVVLNPLLTIISPSTYLSSGAEGGERSHGGNGSQIGGQALGVAAGDSIDEYRACVAQCIKDGMSSGQYAGGGVTISSCKSHCTDWTVDRDSGGSDSGCVIQ